MTPGGGEQGVGEWAQYDHGDAPDEGTDDVWSAVADGWAELWGAVAAPVWGPLLTATGVGPGTRVLDVGCGTGELLERAARDGAEATGVDLAPAMVRHARERVPAATVRVGAAERLPFRAGVFDVILAVNALQLVEDAGAALAELVRVLAPGGRVGLAGWAEGARNDLDVVERAVAAAYEEDPPVDGPLRAPGGFETALRAAGLDVVGSGVTDVAWCPADADGLVRGVLLGEDPATQAELAPAVIAAAAPFRAAGGGYRLAGAFRWAVARAV
ncbi:class I SAM-dependent methyltransferase [Isoptericola sp. NPDC057191]|uniref:class I SAM-dependent methyltransferase n=1 Tax=Isoptericola sp. NPDC057191 TaxID=3346041 RepID=UPI0036370337